MTPCPSLPSGDPPVVPRRVGPACEELEYRLMRGAIRLGRILGIPIGANYTWFIALWVLAWSLADAYYPARFPGFPASTYWTMGLISTILLFASVVVHELGHAVAARRYGIRTRSIVLFMFGGGAQIAEDLPPPSAA